MMVMVLLLSDQVLNEHFGKHVVGCLKCDEVPSLVLISESIGRIYRLPVRSASSRKARLTGHASWRVPSSGSGLFRAPITRM